MTAYTYFTIGGVLAAALTAWVLKGETDNPVCVQKSKPPFLFYISAAFGIVIGAKLPLVVTHGFTEELLHTGKSFCGGLAGAFIAVNLYKYFTRRGGAAFGGRFVIPLAVAAGVGKIGCWVNACCGGAHGIPAQLVESVFQFACAAGLLVYLRKTARMELLFPLYLAFYMTMRFVIEFVRTEPPLALGLTVYQFIALATLPFAIRIIIKRRNNNGNVCM